MRVDVKPFSDNRVRQAMRLIVDRPQMVEQALSGHGRVGNDLFSPFDPSYNRTLPQRHQDIDKAKFLLKQAGHEGLTVTLNSSDPAEGTLQAATVFAQQAKKAGVKVNVNKVEVSVLYGPNYLKWPFAQDFWNSRNYLAQVAAEMIPGAYYNETHWPDKANAKYLKLYKSALATVDFKKRTEMIHEMQKLEWDNGGLIVWGFNNTVDAYSSKLSGLEPSRAQVRFDSYGFQNAWFV
jgi:peptide/nickel transport system substrate-binding protein